MDTSDAFLYPSCSKCSSWFCDKECWEKHFAFCDQKTVLNDELNIHKTFRCCECNEVKEHNDFEPFFVPYNGDNDHRMGVCLSCLGPHLLKMALDVVKYCDEHLDNEMTNEPESNYVAEEIRSIVTNIVPLVRRKDL